MTPEEHYAEAERLLYLARNGILRGAPIGFSTHVEVAHLAQVHATLALYRPPPSDHLAEETTP